MSLLVTLVAYFVKHANSKCIYLKWIMTYVLHHRTHVRLILGYMWGDILDDFSLFFFLVRSAVSTDQINSSVLKYIRKPTVRKYSYWNILWRYSVYKIQFLTIPLIKDIHNDLNFSPNVYLHFLSFFFCFRSLHKKIQQIFNFKFLGKIKHKFIWNVGKLRDFSFS